METNPNYTARKRMYIKIDWSENKDYWKKSQKCAGYENQQFIWEL